jgi:hypothetical protein
MWSRRIPISLFAILLAGLSCSDNAPDGVPVSAGPSPREAISDLPKGIFVRPFEISVKARLADRVAQMDLKNVVNFECNGVRGPSLNRVSHVVFLEFESGFYSMTCSATDGSGVSMTFNDSGDGTIACEGSEPQEIEGGLGRCPESDVSLMFSEVIVFVRP